VLCRDWFQRFVPPESSVLEMAAGYCEFINAIQAAHKTAVDINPDSRSYAGPGVRVVQASATSIPEVGDASQDVVFMSNLLEHLTRSDILLTLAECARILRNGGRILILQPNIRYVRRDYWMFFDHVTPVDDRALCEVLECSGFRVDLDLPRFLPYTERRRLPKSLWLVRAYLRAPALWRVFGGQCFVAATRI
jgi:SAM-dependent methyltransferase